jgi:hypothetical protein
LSIYTDFTRFFVHQFTINTGFYGEVPQRRDKE